MEREWRVISWAHNYEVSNYGEVRRVDNGKYLKPSKTTYGNLNISVPDDEAVIRKRTIASLVAEMFIGKPEEIKGKVLVIHKDRDKLNNRVDNLKYISGSDFNKKYVKKYFTKIKCVETGEIYESQVDAANKIGINRAGINRCLKDPNHTYKGFHFVRVS